ncbi:SWIRM-domain-containing protein [Artomyces pyxidatus]|uniref:SWIRM-domain-containing protein n=1 Tax=Artomyces pyxidatus TaxID=48021 RepID=A0ACB8TCM7_9AGAM|nr:SWIRM-domain-containing protein [Artomyces pyxidatus]
MTVTHRKRQHQPEEISTVNEPGFQIECDGCLTDLTHSIRIKCADPVCEPGDGIDLCPNCFRSGREFGKHKRSHAYRVVELHSYPIFSEDWGADEELLLIEGISAQGLGNWQAIAEHVGTRTKEEVEEHYNSVYIESPTWPRPRMDLEFHVDPSEFQDRKRRRISNMPTAAPAPKVAPTSAPGVHEIATFLPGRLEFEHEVDNEAEEMIKDLEFGLCMEWGGDTIPEDEDDPDVKIRARWEEGKKERLLHPPINVVNGNANGGGVGVNGFYGSNGVVKEVKKDKDLPRKSEDGTENDLDEESEENMPPLPFETIDSLTFKLTLLETYAQRLEKRHEAKAIMFDRGLLEYKKLQAAEKKRLKEEKDIIHRLRPFAKLQTAEDYEVFCADILYEAILRKRITELQQHRRLGLTTASDVKKWEDDAYKRTQAKANMSRDHFSSERLQQLRTASGRPSLGPDSRRTSVAGDGEDRKSHERELTPRTGGAGPSGTRPVGRKPPAPMNLANSPSLHLLTPAEQTLCSTLRILPKPYLVIKETLVREYARRGGKLRRREARDLVKIDVNKTSRVWDFLVQAGYLRINVDAGAQSQSQATESAAGPSGTPGSSQTGVPASPSKSSVGKATPTIPFAPGPNSSANGLSTPILSSLSFSNRPPSTSPWPH